MITFSTEGASLTIKIDTGIPSQSSAWTITSKYGAEHEIYAKLLRDKLHQKLYDQIEAIRKNAYEAGYNDKTKRKTKKDWFSGFIGNKEM